MIDDDLTAAYMNGYHKRDDEVARLKESKVKAAASREDAWAEAARLRAKIERLLGIIEDAPHYDECAKNLEADYSLPCNCWKATANSG